MKPDNYGCINNLKYYDDFDEKIMLVFEPDNGYFTNRLPQDRENYDKIFLFNGIEPFGISNIRDEIVAHKDKFDKIYSYDNVVLNFCDNAELFCFGSSWILTNEQGEQIESKTQGYYDIFKVEDKIPLVSFINSGKSQFEGHHLRNYIGSVLRNISNVPVLFPRTYIETKIPLFTEAMFHVSIENSKIVNYFTEKIIDCFLSKTVPIYWGCPNIGDFFNVDGIIITQNAQDIENILKNLTEEDYRSRLPAILDNYEKALEYAFFYDRVNDLIKL